MFFVCFCFYEIFSFHVEFFKYYFTIIDTLVLAVFAFVVFFHDVALQLVKQFIILVSVAWFTWKQSVNKYTEQFIDSFRHI